MCLLRKCLLVHDGSLLLKQMENLRQGFLPKHFIQIYEVYYKIIYSPTVRTDPLRIMLVVASFRDWEVYQVDVKAAYLKANLKKILTYKLLKEYLKFFLFGLINFCTD